MERPISRPAILATRALEIVRKGETKLNLYAEALHLGYSVRTAKSYKFKQAKEWKRIMAENKEIVIGQLEQERQEILKHMAKTRSKAKYRDLVYSLDITTKNQRLISGESTDNVATQGSIIMLPKP